MTQKPPSNEEIAVTFERVAELLHAQGASPWRINAWRSGAEGVRKLPRAVSEILGQEGAAGLKAATGMGENLASALRELVVTGHLSTLDRLEGMVSPEELFMSVPGVGSALASSVHQKLGIETLEELEIAANDGRLAKVPGFGERRVRMVRESLNTILSGSGRRRGRQARDRDRVVSPEEPYADHPDEPSVAVCLAVDEEYRDAAAKGLLKRITPRRFNPAGDAWLPVLHTERDGWSFTALFSNTRRAHDLGRTHDWVVLYFDRDGHEGQFTIATETHGSLNGKRVIRGRENECRAYHASHAPAAEAHAAVPA